MLVMPNGQTVGAYHIDTIRRVIGNKPVDPNHIIQRACARLMEEAVELCLTAGMSVGATYTAVTDAMHNEALKAKVYPSSFTYCNVDFTNMKVELVDNAICADFIRELCGVEQSRLFVGILEKAELLRLRAEAGELKEVDLNIYKKTSGR